MKTIMLSILLLSCACGGTPSEPPTTTDPAPPTDLSSSVDTPDAGSEDGCTSPCTHVN
jgi:hypothetical protein